MKVNYLNPQIIIEETVRKNGGWVNAHAHLDRAYTLTSANYKLVNSQLQEKWELVDKGKKESTVNQIYDRMAYALEKQMKQGVQAIATFIDVDEVIKDKAVKAAEKIKKTFKKSLTIKFINQVLKGVLEPTAYKWFTEGAQFVDIIGGLPGKDKGREEKHIEILLDTAKRMKKMVHVHVDQLNMASEKETELLARKTIEFGMIGKVVAVHGISIAAHPITYRKKLYKLMKKAGVILVTCPSAWIDSRRSEIKTVTHNSIAPVEELVAAGITVALGTDNIHDIYKPFSDGDMWTELRFLLESCHFYDVEALIKIGSVNGLRALGIRG